MNVIVKIEGKRKKKGGVGYMFIVIIVIIICREYPKKKSFET